MIDLLLINPGAQAIALAQALSANKVSYLVVITSGQMFAYPSDIEVLNLNNSAWDRESQYQSAIAWDGVGQRWLDGISNQVILNNRPLVDRKPYYLATKFETDLGKMFNILSYKGEHVVIDAFVYKDSKWSLIKDQTLPFFVNGIESAFAFLDSVGVLNGPSQVFVKPDGTIHIRLIPKAIDSAKISTRSFLDIWPYILTLEADQPKKARLAFYSWIVRTGSTKKFQLDSGL